MPDFNEFLKVLKGNIEDIAQKSWKEYREAAVKDGESFIGKTKDDLERWTMLLAEGKLTQDDFVWLVQGKKDLAVLEALKQKGLTRVSSIASEMRCLMQSSISPSGFICRDFVL